MTDELPLLIYRGMAVFFPAALVLRLFRYRRSSRIAGAAGTLVSGAGVIALVVVESRLPLFGSLESIIYLSFLLTLLELFTFPERGEAAGDRSFALTMGCICLLLAFQSRRPMVFNTDFFMYDNLWVNLFFNLRLVAGALLTWAAVLFITGAWSGSNSDVEVAKSRRRVLYGGRNFLLTGIAVYLISEWSGSLWCLNWLGDSWQWSRGFFKAGIIFLLVMAASHLPSRFARWDRMRAMFGACPAVVILWMLFHH